MAARSIRTGNIIVAQLGARRDYAVPRALHALGLLEHFYTDLFVPQALAQALQGPARGLHLTPLMRVLGRSTVGLSGARVTSFPLLGLGSALRRRRRQHGRDQLASILEDNLAFCEHVIGAACWRAGTVYGFNSASAPFLEHARRLGLRTVLDQTNAPRELLIEVLSKECQRFPGWEAPPVRTLSHDAFVSIENREWASADIIICGSSFVRDTLTTQGVDEKRCRVVPQAASAAVGVRSREGRSGPLRVLTVGSVGLRKGAQYVLQAARALRRDMVFRMVGPVLVSRAAASSLQECIELTGAIPREEVVEHYEWADVFLLPSLCEGAARVCYEALGAGLPVLCTEAAGSVVEDGLDGYLLPVRDPETIADRLLRLHLDRPLLNEMTKAAQKRAMDLTFEGYASRLAEAIWREPGGSLSTKGPGLC